VIDRIWIGHGAPFHFAWNPVQNRIYAPCSDPTLPYIAVLRDLIPGTDENQRPGKAEPQVRVFPNPARMSFTVYVPPGIRKVKLYDVLGKLVMEEDLSKYINGKTLTVNHLSAGVYFLQSDAGNHILTQKIILLK